MFFFFSFSKISILTSYFYQIKTTKTRTSQPMAKKSIFSHNEDDILNDDSRQQPTIPGIIQPFNVKKDILNIIANNITASDTSNINIIQNKLYKQFLGSQPVSFTKNDITEKLLSQDYYVCEKTDGLRVLMFVIMNPMTNKQNIFFIDRENNFYLNEELNIILPFNSEVLHNGTLIDGELVMQKINKKFELRFLMFDLLMVNNKSIINKPTSSRLAHIGHDVLKPLNELKMKNAQLYSKFEFKFGMKKMEFSYNLVKIFKQIEAKTIPHFSDGLIFTPINKKYQLFTKDDLLLKWKPSNENSIDFKMILRFENPLDPDYSKIPIIDLYVWKGGEDKSFAANPNTFYNSKDLKVLSKTYSRLDSLNMNEKLWKKLVNLNEPLNGRIIECYRNEKNQWCFLRFRDDKLQGNHINVVSSIIYSINDNVQEEELEEIVGDIKKNWDERHPRK